MEEFVGLDRAEFTLNLVFAKPQPQVCLIHCQVLILFQGEIYD
jgi:hypothetical protein